MSQLSLPWKSWEKRRGLNLVLLRLAKDRIAMAAVHAASGPCRRLIPAPAGRRLLWLLIVHEDSSELQQLRAIVRLDTAYR